MDKIVAAFDFDGTLTHRDTLIPFMAYSLGKLRTACNLILLIPYLLAFYFNLRSRQQVKEAFLKKCLRGHSEQSLFSAGEKFAKQKIPFLLKQEALERLRWHQKQDHRCILVSANLNIFLKDWAVGMGFDEVVTSELHFNQQGLFSGKLIGENCWGTEKVNRLQELLGKEKNYLLYAYGDSRGDQELLAYADYPFFRSFN